MKGSAITGPVAKECVSPLLVQSIISCVNCPLGGFVAAYCVECWYSGINVCEKTAMPRFLVRLSLLQSCLSEMQYAYDQPITDSRRPIWVFSLKLALAHRLQGTSVLKNRSNTFRWNLQFNRFIIFVSDTSLGFDIHNTRQNWPATGPQVELCRIV